MNLTAVEPSAPAGLLTTAEAAKMLACREGTIRNLTRSGELAAVRVGRLVRYRPEDIQVFVEQNLTTSY